MNTVLHTSPPWVRYSVGTVLLSQKLVHFAPRSPHAALLRQATRRVLIEAATAATEIDGWSAPCFPFSRYADPRCHRGSVIQCILAWRLLRLLQTRRLSLCEAGSGASPRGLFSHSVRLSVRSGRPARRGSRRKRAYH